MEYEKTINKILQRLEKEIPITEIGDLLETQKTIYPPTSIPREDKNIIINSVEVTPPLACSKEWKKMLVKEKAPLCQIFKDLSRGDILKIKRVENGFLIVENLSLDDEFKKEFKLCRTEVIKKNFSVIKRRSVGMSRILEKIEQQS